MARDKTRMKRKERKNIATGVAHVNSSFNNTKILISDVQGNAISWSSAEAPPRLIFGPHTTRTARRSRGSVFPFSTSGVSGHGHGTETRMEANA